MGVDRGKGEEKKGKEKGGSHVKEGKKESAWVEGRKRRRKEAKYRGKRK